MMERHAIAEGCDVRHLPGDESATFAPVPEDLRAVDPCKCVFAGGESRHKAQ